jgi:hypothetical protein
MAKVVDRAERVVIPMQEEIYSSLRRGDIDGFARRNGSSDIVSIEPIQWAALRFRAFEGHNIAVPVDSEQNPLPLAGPLSDYLAGMIPPMSAPTVWPDPVFQAERVMALWPATATLEVSADEHEQTRSEVPVTHVHRVANRQPQSGMPRPIVGSGELRKWYETYIADRQRADKPSSEAEDWANAKDKFGIKVRRHQIRELRPAVAPRE